MEQIDLFSETRQDTDRAVIEAVTNTEELGKLFELSVDAYYSVLYARMSGFPLEKEISRFIEKVCNTGEKASFTEETASIITGNSIADRTEANRIACNMTDSDVLAIQRAAHKVVVEIHRIKGFLRFNPDKNGVYTALCAPDFFILPALAEHFALRFGETPWAIIDEKRKLCLYRINVREAELIPLERYSSACTAETLNEQNQEHGKKDGWEDLWRLYHRSVNNESRKNPRLQRQFMPERYQKYLPELK